MDEASVRLTRLTELLCSSFLTFITVTVLSGQLVTAGDDCGNLFKKIYILPVF